MTDNLSRREETDDNTILMVTAVEAYWIDQVRGLVQTDNYYQELNTKWEEGTLDLKGVSEKRWYLLLLA